MEIQKGAKIGFASRIDFGSKGFRQSVVNANFELFRKEGTHFNVLAGGLIAEKAVLRKMKAYVKDVIETERDKIRDRNERIKRLNKKRKKPLALAPLLTGEHLVVRKSVVEEDFLRTVAEQLAKVIPVLTEPDPENPTKERAVDLFITTSPAFDGEIGERIAQIISEIRKDIRVWNVGGDRKS